MVLFTTCWHKFSCLRGVCVKVKIEKRVNSKRKTLKRGRETDRKTQIQNIAGIECSSVYYEVEKGRRKK
ncbi:hypothetical protein VTP01DRAFT_82 [Rhizomucor pusillus]|uniref:uncharacterized protein n=1 Tax=Rhizomucor pusillus TaxID=4840 RepID=UPI0037441FF8